MKYRIGDVSKILGLSDQMIRYYEKYGVLNPERSGDERYRYYTDMDIFMLFDAMRYKEWGINIAEIGDLVANDYYDRLILKLQEYRRNLDQEIAYKEVRKRRVAWMERRLTLCRLSDGQRHSLHRHLRLPRRLSPPSAIVPITRSKKPQRQTAAKSIRSAAPSKPATR